MRSRSPSPLSPAGATRPRPGGNFTASAVVAPTPETTPLMPQSELVTPCGIWLAARQSINFINNWNEKRQEGSRIVDPPSIADDHRDFAAVSWVHSEFSDTDLLAASNEEAILWREFTRAIGNVDSTSGSRLSPAMQFFTTGRTDSIVNLSEPLFQFCARQESGEQSAATTPQPTSTSQIAKNWNPELKPTPNKSNRTPSTPTTKTTTPSAYTPSNQPIAGTPCAVWVRERQRSPRGGWEDATVWRWVTSSFSTFNSPLEEYLWDEFDLFWDFQQTKKATMFDIFWVGQRYDSLEFETADNLIQYCVNTFH